MRENFYLWLFILLIPTFLVLGHDSYIAFGDSEEKINALKQLKLDQHRFRFSDLGYLWISYAPGSLNFIRDMISTDAWSGILAPLIEQKAILIAIIPPAIFASLGFAKGILDKLMASKVKKTKYPSSDLNAKQARPVKQKKYKRK